MPNSLASAVQGGWCEGETLRSTSQAAVPSRAAGSVGKRLQAEVALTQSSLPAKQFKCMIAVDINNLEG